MAEEKKKRTSELTRREFLKDAGILVGGTAIGSTILLAACAGEETTETVTTTATATTTQTATQTATKTVEVPGPTITKTVEVPGPVVAPENVVKLTVNGKPYEFQVEPEEILRDVIRNKVGLKSPKDMCNGYGACGSCTVIMDGRPILSCMALAIECDGATIETAEGLAAAEHPLIETYVKNHCMQCGYCTPGFIVTAKALLDHNPNPTEANIRDALGGNICRCGTYLYHIKAVLEAAEAL